MLVALGPGALAAPAPPADRDAGGPVRITARRDVTGAPSPRAPARAPGARLALPARAAFPVGPAARPAPLPGRTAAGTAWLPVPGPVPVPERVVPAAEPAAALPVEAGPPAGSGPEPHAALGQVVVAGPGLTLEERRGVEALALIPYPWEWLGFDVVFLPGREGYRARTFRDERRIEVYVRRGDGVRQVAFDLGHELGHAVDLVANTPVGRARWLLARGIGPGLPWFGCDDCPDQATPAGDFAESFAAWLVGPVDFGSRLGGVPDQAQQRLLAELAAVRASATSGP